MASAFKTWRQERREADFWRRATQRADVLPRGEVLDVIDTTIMMAGRAVSQYRATDDPERREDQLCELRMNLEASLGMVDNLVARQRH